ncbi:TPA: phage tail tube protein [Clostridioides difficile]|uniref:phage tail tube protein n=1 Tax=Clostridioides difficile TaxID=1496 RepID=UPI000DED8580|nr:phage tail tube protein [Clostridioides difficile]MBH7395167.1 phage tail tube protein [Clostridioides difficile]HBG7170970.1 phage tail tube protein [Clostridioides difficile]HBH1505769.1 phage tail tube protein [Clostridioides difficile]HBH1510749.1 phage tail tube protein [Clostridioides difficile]HBH3454077.1 phage tail tube protein [Clostridioides difficile]
MATSYESNQVMNGTYGECWLDGVQVSECKAMKAEIKLDKAEIVKPRKMIKGQKVIGASAEGSITLYHVDSNMLKYITQIIKEGREPKFTIISKLADPDAKGVERISLTGVSFDGLSIIDWENGKEGEIEASFTFEDFEILDAA